MEDWTLKMHEIAVKTEQETVSMHVITVFTLIFLPGTFLAVRYLFRRYYHQLQRLLYTPNQHLLTSPRQQTFFSSGILDWNNDDVSWDVRGGAMRLFFYICVPMMLLIIAGWFLLYYILARRNSRKRMNEVLEEAGGEFGPLEAPDQNISKENSGFFARVRAIICSGQVGNKTSGAQCARSGRFQEK